MKEFLVLFLGLFLLSSPILSSNYFSKESIQYADQAGQGFFDDPYIYSVWGANDFFTSNINAGRNVLTRKVASPYFYDGKIDYRFGISKNAKGRAPLMIYLPGIYARLKSNQNNRMIKSHKKKGVHTLVFQNPLNADFIKKGPLYNVGDPIAEARVLYDAIRKLVAEFKKGGYLNGTVHLSGVSYGAFLSSIIASMDAFHKRPILTGNVTVFSPPFHFLKTMKKLDTVARNTEEDYSHLSFNKVAKRASGIFFLDNASEVEEHHFRDSRGIVAHFVFKENFIKSLQEYNKHTNILEIPKKKKEFRKWYKEMSFINYYKRHLTKSYKELKGVKGSIRYWMNRYRFKTKKLVRVITSRDDFLNNEDDWENFSRDQVIVLQNGGHYGYRKEPWFAGLLGTIFR